jgi:PAS domain S-box-containing protein
MTGTSTNITEQREAKAALEESEKRARDQLAELENLYQTAPVGLCLVDRDLRWIRINERLARFHGPPVSEHIGRQMRELIPDVAAKVEPAYRRVFETGEPIVDMEVRGTTSAEPDGERYWLASFYPLTRDDGTVDAVSNVVQDITARKRAETLQAGINRVLELLAKDRSLTEVLTELATTVESQCGAGPRCAILLVDEQGPRLRVHAAPSLPPAFTEGVDGLPIGPAEGSCGAAAYRGEPIIVMDINEDPVWEKYRDLATRFGLRASWSIPILSESGQVLGALSMYHTRVYTPSPAELDVTTKAAALATVAIEHTRALDSLQDRESALRESHAKIRDLAGKLIAAQEEERRRLSRELHDGLNQHLAALSFEIGFLRSRLPEENTDVRERLRQLQARAAQVIDDARHMSRELHPASLEHLGLVAALRSHCMEIEKQEGIRAKLTLVKVPENISREVALCLYRVAQEGLRNAVKHSGAPEVRVTLTGADRSIELYIADSGSGFDGEQIKAGLGLVSMEERVRLLGGSFRITTRPRLGTRLEVRIPIGTNVQEPLPDPSIQEHGA